jgi:hypothetical protein
MERATFGSIAIHLVVAISIPALAWTASDALPVETVSFTHVLHVQIVRPHEPSPHPRAAAPLLKDSPSLNFANRVTLAALPRHRQSAKVAIATNAPAAPAVAVVQQAGDSTARGDAAPVPTPSPVVRAVAHDVHQAGGFLPFGAEVPAPVLDPTVRKALDALGTHVTLIVTVGDDGRTTNVVFQPSLDPQTENRIRSLLADASWDPAVCGGGVACEAQATIKL